MDPQALRPCALFQTLSSAQLAKIAALAEARDLPGGGGRGLVLAARGPPVTREVRRAGRRIC